MSVAAHKQITAIHKNDPEWIIRLWLAIHGGDPAPEVTARAVDAAAVAAIKSLSTYLDPAKQKAINAALH